MKKVEQDLIKRLIKLLDEANELIADVECEEDQDEECDYLHVLYDDLIEIEACISDVVYDEDRDDIGTSWYNLAIESEVDE